MEKSLRQRNFLVKADKKLILITLWVETSENVPVELWICLFCCCDELSQTQKSLQLAACKETVEWLSLWTQNKNRKIIRYRNVCCENLCEFCDCAAVSSVLVKWWVSGWEYSFMQLRYQFTHDIKFGLISLQNKVNLIKKLMLPMKKNSVLEFGKFQSTFAERLSSNIFLTFSFRKNFIKNS